MDRYLTEDSDRLKTELNTWKQTRDFVIFWMERNRTQKQLNSRTAISTYTQNILQQETTALTTDDFQIAGRPEIGTAPTPQDDTSAQENDLPSDESPTSSPTASIFTDVMPIHPWQFAGMDIAGAFNNYKLAVNGKTVDNLLPIETHIHEILALSNTLLLCPNQHSDMMMEYIPEEILCSLHTTLLGECLDINKSWTDNEYIKVTRIVDEMTRNMKEGP